jgi:hypothetical protein
MQQYSRLLGAIASTGHGERAGYFLRKYNCQDCGSMHHARRARRRSIATQQGIADHAEVC